MRESLDFRYLVRLAPDLKNSFVPRPRHVAMSGAAEDYPLHSDGRASRPTRLERGLGNKHFKVLHQV